MRTYPSEIQVHADPLTGRTVRQLTGYKGHSHHLYFTNPGWWDAGRRLLFGSDRMGETNLFSLDLECGEIRQHTDIDAPHSSFLTTALHPTAPECYFWRDRSLVVLDLKTNAQRVVWECPPGFQPLNVCPAADGSALYTGIVEDLTQRITLNLAHGYVGFNELSAARPQSRLFRVPLDGRPAEMLWEEPYWISHINASPTQPHLLTFCHEGPWESVDNRIWLLDALSGKVTPLRPRQHPDERVGHEYWHADGLTVGYHGHFPTAGHWFFGSIGADNAGREETIIDSPTNHVHSNDASLVVGDGPGTFDPPLATGRGLMRLWAKEGPAMGPARILCRHDCTARIQQHHVHPRFSPDGTKILFTSDRTTYGQIYEVEIGDWRTLPLLDDVERPVK